jgi:hypothetical protein
MSNPERVNPETGVHETLSFGILGSTWIQTGDVATRTNTETGEIETESFGIFCSTWLSTGERVNTQTGEREYIGHGILGSSWMSTEERIDPETGEIQTQGHGILGSSWNSKYDSPKRINTENGEYETQSFGVIGSSWNGGSGQTYQREYDSDSNSSYGGGSTSSWADSVEDEYDPYYDDDDSDDYDEDDNDVETSSNYESDFDEDEDYDSEDSAENDDDYDESENDLDDEDSEEDEDEYSLSSDEIPDIEHLISMTQVYIKHFELILDMLKLSLVSEKDYKNLLINTNELLTKIGMEELCVEVNGDIELLNHPKYEVKIIQNSKYNSYAESDVLNHPSLLLFKKIVQARISALQLGLNQPLNVESEYFLLKEKQTTFKQIKIDEGYGFQNYTDYFNNQLAITNYDYFKPFDFIIQRKEEDVESCKLILQNILAIAQEYDQFKLLNTAKYFKSVYDLLTLFSFYTEYCDHFESIEKFFDSFGDTDAFEIEHNQSEYLDCNIAHPNSVNLCSIIEENLKIIYENSLSFIDSMS